MAEEVKEVCPEASVEEPKVETKLEEAAPAEEPKAEEPKEEEAEAPKEEEKPAEEEKPEEKVEEAPVEEAPAEKVDAPVEEKPEEKEALSEDISTTREELAVVTEVRNELVTLYAHNKEIETNREQLAKANEKLTAENLKLAEKLSKYEVAEKEMLAKVRRDKVERLSAKFTKLGQSKSVEQLSKLDDETVEQFEEIVDAALEKAGESKELPEVTSPSQAAVERAPEPVKVEEKSEEVVEEPKEAPKQDSEAFFGNICKELTREQTRTNGNSKVRFM